MKWKSILGCKYKTFKIFRYQEITTNNQNQNQAAFLQRRDKLISNEIYKYTIWKSPMDLKYEPNKCGHQRQKVNIITYKVNMN